MAPRPRITIRITTAVEGLQGQFQASPSALRRIAEAVSEGGTSISGDEVSMVFELWDGGSGTRLEYALVNLEVEVAPEEYEGPDAPGYVDGEGLRWRA